MSRRLTFAVASAVTAGSFAEFEHLDYERETHAYECKRANFVRHCFNHFVRVPNRYRDVRHFICVRVHFLSVPGMADRHRAGMEAVIDRLEQVREELSCSPKECEHIVAREINKVKRKQLKVVKKFKQLKQGEETSPSQAA